MVTYAEVAVEGASLWTATSDAGRPVVLAHGGPGWCDNLGPVAEMLSAQAQVHRHDQRACGRSTGSSQGQTVASAVRDLEALRQHVGHEAWVVGGHSWGAFLALAYALTHPERTRAVLHLAGPGPEPEVDGSLSLREQRLSSAQRVAWSDARARARRGDLDAAALSSRFFWRTDFADPRRVPDLDASPLYACPRNEEVAEVLGASRRSWIADGGLLPAHQLTVPVLLVHGRQDPLPVSGARAWHERLPVSELVELEGVGHVPWLEDPVALHDALVGFLAHLPG